MFAVIQTGGKQYLAKTGDTLKVERLDGEKGDAVTFDQVLMTANDDGSNVTMGSPFVSGATVKAEIVSQTRSKKIRVVKYKRKVRYRRARGHRQYVTTVKIV